MAKTDRNSMMRRDRRCILRTLDMVFPGSMPLEELFLIVLDSNPVYTRVFLTRDVFYLREKGYLAVSRIDGGTLTNVSVQSCKAVLTAAGSDVANQLVDDPTLDV